jgi:hypothetical protein
MTWKQIVRSIWKDQRRMVTIQVTSHSATKLTLIQSQKLQIKQVLVLGFSRQEFNVNSGLWASACRMLSVNQPREKPTSSSIKLTHHPAPPALCKAYRIRNATRSPCRWQLQCFPKRWLLLNIRWDSQPETEHEIKQPQMLIYDLTKVQMKRSSNVSIPKRIIASTANYGTLCVLSVNQRAISTKPVITN